MSEEIVFIIIGAIALLGLFFPIYHWSDFTDELAIGEIMYYSETSLLDVEIPTYNNYYPVTNLTCSNNVNVYCNSENLTIQVEGYYAVNLQASFEGGANTEYELELFVNEGDAKDCELHRKTGTGGDVGNAGFTCVQYLYEGDIVNVKAKDNTNPSNDISFHSFNLNILKINGGLDD